MTDETDGAGGKAEENSNKTLTCKKILHLEERNFRRFWE